MSTMQTKKRVVRIPRETRTQMKKDLGVKLPATICRKKIDRLFEKVLASQLIAA